MFLNARPSSFRWPRFLRASPGLALVVAAVAIALGVTLTAPPRADLVPETEEDAPRAFAIENARVFDGERLLPEATVVVRDGRIVAVGSGVEIPSDAARIDAAGHTLLPGLIDAHTHSWGLALKRALAFGVTTHLDQFTYPAFAQAAAEEQKSPEGAPERADLLSAGVLATAPGGHGTQFGLPIPTLDGPEDAGPWVEGRLAEGSRWIKIVLEDGSEFGREIPTLDEATARALVQAAHEHEVLAVVHPGKLAYARAALEAGADGLVHLFSSQPIPDDFIELARESGAFVIPTVAIFESALGVPGGAELAQDPRLAPRLNGTEIEGLRSTLRPATWEGDGEHPALAATLAAVVALHRAGVPILAGSDAPNPGTTYGASLHRELELLVRAGLTPTEALAAATSKTADAFRLADRGRIEPGRRADLLLVAGDPTEDITATRALRKVWKGGVPTGLAPEDEERTEAKPEQKKAKPEQKEVEAESEQENRNDAG